MERAHGTGSWNGLIERDRARVHVRAHGMGSCMGSWNGLMQGLMYGLMSIQKIVLSLSRSTWNRCEKTVARATFRLCCVCRWLFLSTLNKVKAIHGFLAALTRGDKEEMSTLKYRPRALHFVIQYATCTLAKLKIKLVDPLSQEMSKKIATFQDKNRKIFQRETIIEYYPVVSELRLFQVFQRIKGLDGWKLTLL
ncbi:hypothetical protein V1477_014825 [Vespula maculifrons]|uniref:Uncharacterized protein n=1 Tax=Vespula maculifrons TaxID=7453 RepID=A0ABD2BJ18_VESMC